jgi:hypothetical protein
MKKKQQDISNRAHVSDNTAQNAARALLEGSYRDYSHELDARETFIGVKGGRQKTYRTVEAGVNDGAEFIRWNLDNL